MNKMGEIKIIVSDQMEKLIENLSDSIGIKKTEYVKGLVVEEFKRLKKNGVMK
jgi:hypothetical protein